MKPGVTIDKAKASLQPLMHQMLNLEVEDKAFSKAAPETKQAFLRMWLDLLPASKGRSYLRDQFSNSLLVLRGRLWGLVLADRVRERGESADRKGDRAAEKKSP